MEWPVSLGQLNSDSAGAKRTSDDVILAWWQVRFLEVVKMEATTRVEREQQSYDDGRVLIESNRLHSRFRHIFDCPNTRFCERYMQNQIRSRLKNSRILDYGCGNGWYSAHLLSAGASRVVGIDISAKNIAEAKLLHGTMFGSQNTAEFHVMDAHHLSFPDQSFDLVIGRAILHHLEFETAIREVVRVLKKGGCAIFAEPLRDNPMAKLYRFLTPSAHTPDELPLSRKQIVWANGLFSTSHHLFCGFLSTALGLFTSSLFQNADNTALRFADSIDRLIMRTPLRYWMRYVYLVWEK